MPSEKLSSTRVRSPPDLEIASPFLLRNETWRPLPYINIILCIFTFFFSFASISVWLVASFNAGTAYLSEFPFVLFFASRCSSVVNRLSCFYLCLKNKLNADNTFFKIELTEPVLRSLLGPPLIYALNFIQLYSRISCQKHQHSSFLLRHS